MQGCGKTFLENTLLAAVRATGGEAIAVATTGIAASLLDGGTTAHSRFKIPMALTDISTCNLKKRTEEAEAIQRCRLLVWDEAGMANRWAVEAVDRTLRDLRECDRPFGGLLTLFAGDWQQILPVVRGAARHQVVAACLKASPLWRHVVCVQLHTNMRVQLQGDVGAGEYAHFLALLGSGSSSSSVGWPKGASSLRALSLSHGGSLSFSSPILASASSSDKPGGAI